MGFPQKMQERGTIERKKGIIESSLNAVGNVANVALEIFPIFYRNS